jgi:lysophospholipase L1-like esterase
MFDKKLAITVLARQPIGEQYLATTFYFEPFVASCSMKVVLFVSLCFQAFHLIAAEDGAILVLGDSWASLSGDVLSNICGPGTSPRNIQNDAKSGSTAAEWASKEMAASSLSKAKFDHDYVWLSVGGNDFLDSKCDIGVTEQVATNVLQVISHIVENSSNEDLRILYFGYSYPSKDICGGGTTADLFDASNKHIRDAIKNSNYSDYVKVLDISNEFVTAGSAPLSDEKWYADAIHMNQYGYVKLFSKISIQMFFGCTSVVPVLVNGVATVSNWSLAKTLGVAIGTLLFFILLCRLCCCKQCKRSKPDTSEKKGTTTIPKDGVVDSC